MSIAKSLEASIAATRFGLGAKPGELAKIADSPRGWLKSQITRDGAEQPGGLPGSADRFAAFLE